MGLATWGRNTSLWVYPTVALGWLRCSVAVILVLVNILLLLTIWLLFNSSSFHRVENRIPLQSFVLAPEVGMGMGRDLWAEGKQFESDGFYSISPGRSSSVKPALVRCSSLTEWGQREPHVFPAFFTSYLLSMLRTCPGVTKSDG